LSDFFSTIINESLFGSNHYTFSIFLYYNIDVLINDRIIPTTNPSAPFLYNAVIRTAKNNKKSMKSSYYNFNISFINTIFIELLINIPAITG